MKKVEENLKKEIRKLLNEMPYKDWTGRTLESAVDRAKKVYPNFKKISQYVSNPSTILQMLIKMYSEDIASVSPQERYTRKKIIEMLKKTAKDLYQYTKYLGRS